MIERLADRLPPLYRDAFETLLSGDLRSGFHKFEGRYRPITPSGLQWTGQPLQAGQRMLLLAGECGYGDDIQFIRYARMVADQGIRVQVLAPMTLVRLLATAAGVAEVTPAYDPKNPRLAPAVSLDYHYWCSLISLPYACGTTLDTIPPAPYLHASTNAWTDVLQRMKGLKVGLCWAGRSIPGHPLDDVTDKVRSIKLAMLAPILAVEGCRFVSLQVGPASAQTDKVRGLVVRNVAKRLKDWAATAGLISGLDLVITVDTGVCHLAGALGKPVFMLNKWDTCWRWLKDRADSPWYPSMTIFRQPDPGDWATPIAKARDALMIMAHQQETADAS